MLTKKWDRLLLPGVAALTLAIDQSSKYLVRTNLAPNESWNPIPALQRWFSITHVTNTGAAFGLFPNLGSVFVIIAVVVSVAIVVYHRYLPPDQWLIKISLGLQLGGALGNLIDRLRMGHVTDFIDFKIWPVSNLADGAIVLGVIVLAYYLLFRDESAEQATEKAIPSSGEGIERSKTG